MEETEKAYLAGLVDGEGYIGIKKSKPPKGCVSPSYSARIQIRMVDEPAIAFLSDSFSLNYYKEKPSAVNGRPLFCFQASNHLAAFILYTLYPYLRVKVVNAQVVLQLHELKQDSRKHRTKVVGTRPFKHWAGSTNTARVMAMSDEYVARCEALYIQAKALNHA